jgi:hypothetical protein
MNEDVLYSILVLHAAVSMQGNATVDMAATADFLVA